MERDPNEPNPDRFETFTETADGKGFKIKNSKYIYMFDHHGGWYDEYDNYYTADGDPEDPPSDEDLDFERVVVDNGDAEDYDEFDREFGSGMQQTEDFGNGGKFQEEQFESKKKSSGKKYVTKGKVQVSSGKSQLSKEQKEHLNEKVAEHHEVKQEISKPQEKSTWDLYEADVSAFPLKSSFREWMSSMSLQEEEHYRNIQKVPQPEGSTKKVARMELRSDAHSKIEGLLYQKKKLHFEKVTQ